MDRKRVDWTGYIPAITTPFTRNGRVDLDSFSAQMNWLMKERMHGVIPAGTSGEWFSLSTPERTRLFKAGAQHRKDGLTVIGACNAFTAAETIIHARAAENAGLDGILLTPPPYVVPNRAKIVQFYRTVSDATDIPMTVSNWPRGCVVDMAPDLLDKLADIDTVVTIKNSTGTFADFLEAVYRVEAPVR